MGLFGKKKKEEASDNREGASLAGGASVEPISKSSEELQSLLNEFREMRTGADNRAVDEGVQEAEEILEEVEEFDGSGDEYEVSESESESIESFLSAGDEFDEEPIEEELEEELVEEAVEDEFIEEEPIEEAEDEFIDEEPVEEVEDSQEEEFEEEVYDNPEEEAVAVEVDIKIPDDTEDEVIEDEVNEEEQFEDEEIIEEQFEDGEITDEQEEVIEESSYDASEEEIVEEPQSEPVREDFVTSEDIDKKFDDFEKRLLDKLLAQFSQMQPMMQPVAQAPVAKKEELKLDDEELKIETIAGKLVINGYTFNGEVVMFTPISSLKKASWEEVVRRKGHCTYHLTTSGNGGWFIKKSNAPNPYAYIEKKEEAEELAKFYAMREKAELKIHNSKGVIEKSLSFGREKLRG